MGLSTRETDLAKVHIETGSENWTAAAYAVNEAERYTLNNEEKKIVADARAKIPAHVMQKIESAADFVDKIETDS